MPYLSFPRIGLTATLCASLFCAVIGSSSAVADSRGYFSFGFSGGGYPSYYGGRSHYYGGYPSYYGYSYQRRSYRPPDVYHAPPETPQRQSESYDTSYCREYQSSVTIAGKRQPTYGAACRQPDGTWRIIN